MRKGQTRRGTPKVSRIEETGPMPVPEQSTDELIDENWVVPAQAHDCCDRERLVLTRLTHDELVEEVLASRRLIQKLHRKLRLYALVYEDIDDDRIDKLIEANKKNKGI